MPFATAQREKPPKPKGCIQNPELKSPLHWQTLVTSYFYISGDVQRRVASWNNEENALTFGSELFICQPTRLLEFPKLQKGHVLFFLTEY